MDIAEKHSESSAASYKEAKAQHGNDRAHAINERRRAALEDIDNAKFSCVPSSMSKLACV